MVPGKACEWAHNYTRNAKTASPDFNHMRCERWCEDIAEVSIPIDVIANIAHAAIDAGYGCYLSGLSYSVIWFLNTNTTPSFFKSLSLMNYFC